MDSLFGSCGNAILPTVQLKGNANGAILVPMRALAFWNAVTLDHTDFLERLLGMFDEQVIPYCIIGGQAVNAYAEPVVSLDLDVVVAVDRMIDAIKALNQRFTVERFPHSLNVSAKGSDLRVQIHTD